MTKKPTEKLTQIYKFTDLPNLITNGDDIDIDEVISKLQQAKSEGHDKINLTGDVVTGEGANKLGVILEGIRSEIAEVMGRNKRQY